MSGDLKRKLDNIHEALDKALNPTSSKREYGILTVVFPYNTPGVSFFSCNSSDRTGIVAMMRQISDQVEKGQPPNAS